MSFLIPKTATYTIIIGIISKDVQIMGDLLLFRTSRVSEDGVG